MAGVARPLERAFSTRNARAVALLINSPGGSPAQSHLIFRRIRQLAEEKNVPVLAFVEDVGASGGYMLACAADEIICDQFSIVGSIGVVGGSFGFPKLMEKLGIERRVYTAGERKVMLDPFQPENPRTSNASRRSRRTSTITSSPWSRQGAGPNCTAPRKRYSPANSGRRQKAIELGLADSIGDIRANLRERYGEKVRTPLIAAERGMFGRRLPGVGALEGLLRQEGFAADVISALEARALWSRYGL